VTEPAAGTNDRGAPGGAPDGKPELGDQVAEQAATGISSPDADEHAGQEAPASEGELPG
jgi:hypothetical protein